MGEFWWRLEEKYVLLAKVTIILTNILLDCYLNEYLM